MSAMVGEVSSLRIHRRFVSAARAFTRCPPVLAGVFLMFAALPAWAQTPAFDPTFTVGAGIQASYQNLEPSVGPDVNQFTLDHARLYFGGDVTKDISVMFNTDYSSVTDNMQILDAVGEYHPSAKFNLWFGRFLEPSDRANLYGPFYSHEWAAYHRRNSGRLHLRLSRT